MANISHIPKLIASKLGISLQFCRYLTLNAKIINQNVVINGSDVIDRSDKVWIVQNGNISLISKLIVSKLGISL